MPSAAQASASHMEAGRWGIQSQKTPKEAAAHDAVRGARRQDKTQRREDNDIYSQRYGFSVSFLQPRQCFWPLLQILSAAADANKHDPPRKERHCS